MFAEISLVGRVSFIGDLREVGGSKVVNFGVATERAFTQTSENGEPKTVKETSFWTCSAWGRDATNFVEYKKVGDVLMVKGTPNIKEHEGKTYVNIRSWLIRYLPTPPKKESEGGVPQVKREVIED